MRVLDMLKIWLSLGRMGTAPEINMSWLHLEHEMSIFLVDWSHLVSQLWANNSKPCCCSHSCSRATAWIGSNSHRLPKWWLVVWIAPTWITHLQFYCFPPLLCLSNPNNQYPQLLVALTHGGCYNFFPFPCLFPYLCSMPSLLLVCSFLQGDRLILTCFPVILLSSHVSPLVLHLYRTVSPLDYFSRSSHISPTFHQVLQLSP